MSLSSPAQDAVEPFLDYFFSPGTNFSAALIGWSVKDAETGTRSREAETELSCWKLRGQISLYTLLHRVQLSCAEPSRVELSGAVLIQYSNALSSVQCISHQTQWRECDSMFVCVCVFSTSKHNPYFEIDGRELACLNAPFKLKDMKSDFAEKMPLLRKKKTFLMLWKYLIL